MTIASDPTLVALWLWSAALLVVIAALLAVAATSHRILPQSAARGRALAIVATPFVVAAGVIVLAVVLPGSVIAGSRKFVGRVHLTGAAATLSLATWGAAALAAAGLGRDAWRLPFQRRIAMVAIGGLPLLAILAVGVSFTIPGVRAFGA